MRTALLGLFLALVCSIAVAHTDGIYNRAANSIGDTQGIDSNGGGNVQPTKLLDTLSVSSSVAYSTRKIRSAYGGSALRVVRSSDSAQSDIGFAGNGQLDTTTLTTFCAATNCTVVTWYDQSTNANNSTFLTASPRIVNAGAVDTLNGFPAIRFGPVATAAMQFTVSLSQPTTIALATKLNSQVNNAHFTDGAAGTPRQLFGDNGSGANWSIYAGSAQLNSAAAKDLLSHDFIAIFNGASSSVVMDGTSIISGNPGADGLANQTIGSGNGGGGNIVIDGWIGEYIVFASVLGAPDQALIRTSWQTQWGTL